LAKAKSLVVAEPRIPLVDERLVDLLEQRHMRRARVMTGSITGGPVGRNGKELRQGLVAEPSDVLDRPRDRELAVWLVGPEHVNRGLVFQSG
jgi:hypothetical protein